METQTEPEFEGMEGMEGVVVAQSRICLIDGHAGKLIYGGYNVQDLAEHCSFEEVCHLLWHGQLPNAGELKELQAELALHRALSSESRRLIGRFPRSSYPMSVLRTAVSSLGLHDPRAESDARKTNIAMASELTAQLPTIVATFHRLRQGLEPMVPDPGMSHAANFLYMLTGEYPHDIDEVVMDDALVLHAEHGFNASTFSARVTASTLSDIYSSVTSAIGTLRGPLHGGANMAVMRMLEEISTADRARAYVLNLLQSHQRVMGFGHRVYKTVDPRAVVLRRWCRELGKHTDQQQWFEIGAVIEEVMEAEKGLYCNVDFYSAPVYHMMGIPTDLFTVIFAISRVAGWTAHILEQYGHNRLIRPTCEYVGPRDLTVTPIAQR